MQQNALAVEIVPPDDLDGFYSAEEPPRARASIIADAALAARCVAGEVVAWEELYAQCHAPLCVAIQHMLGGRSFDASLVDEIAARVWYALVAKDGQRLARYSPKQGARLITYLRGMARDELGRHYRSEIRRRRRETIFAKFRPKASDSDLESSPSVVAEFLDTLTPAERGFCCEVLLSDESAEEKSKRSQTNIWQLTRRTYKKMMRFLGC